MPEKKTIIAFAGRNGSGKGTATKHAARMLTAPQHTYSDVLYEIHGVCGVPRESVTRPTLQELSTVLRKWFGQDCLARVMAMKCEGVLSVYVTIDGVRRTDDSDTLEGIYGEGLYMVWIEAEADLRYARLKERKEKAGEEMMSREAFDAQEMAESERGLDAVKAKCRTVIDNNGTPEQLAAQIDALVAAIVHHGPVPHE